MGAIDADSGSDTAARNDRVFVVMILAVMIFEVMIFGVVVRHNSTPNLAASHHGATPRTTLQLWHSTGIR